MKKRRLRKSLTISKSRWLSYATAGAATALGAASSTEAEIHYSGEVRSNIFPDFLHSFRFNVDHAARLVFRYSSYSLLFSVASAAVSGQFRGYRTRHGFTYIVSRLAPGIPVSQGSFVGTTQDPFGFFISSYFVKGPWNPYGPRAGFVGFRFDNGSGQQYGWMRLLVRHGGPFDFGAILVDYAWGDPGDRILTGQKSSSGEMVNAVPVGGSLGLLALGGTGLDEWRKERAKSVKSQP
ncbi:MAG TPA: hypothetical protein VGI60_05845 [Chthoniobacterales bacterium]